MADPAARSEIHPVTQWQRFLLDQDAHPDCRDDLRKIWLLATATLVRPRVDLRRLQRAVAALGARHDTLRIRLERVRGDWRAVIPPPVDAVIPEVDLGDVDDATFHGEILAIARAPMPLIGGPLAEMVLVRCGARGDVIVNRIHHALTDGFGMVVIHDDLMRYLLSIPILSRAVSHADYLVRFHDPAPSQAAAKTAFWREMHRDLPRALDAGRKAKGLEPLWFGLGEVAYRQLDVTPAPGSLERLRDEAGARGSSLPLALYTGFLEALCRVYDAQALAFITHVARTDPRLETYVGDHTLNPVLPYRAAGQGGLAAAEYRLRETVAGAITHLPHEAARPGTDWERALVAEGCFPGQFSAYQPRALARQKRSPWSEGLTSEPGVEHRLGPFGFTALDVSVPQRAVHDMQFRIETHGSRAGFALIFDSISYAPDEVEQLAARICDLLGLEPAGMVLT